MTRPLFLPVVVLLAAGAVFPASAERPVTIVAATVERVIDGDTIHVQAYPWPRVVWDARVRIASIDAPEISRPRCQDEDRAGHRAAARARELLPLGSWVRLVLVEGGRRDVYGRVVADVILDDGRDFGRVLIGEGLAIPYTRERANPWC